MERRQYTIDDLLYLMGRLRDPDTGCPWDARQTYKTIVPFTLEEVYEVIDTIEREDYPHLREELGDLLFQTVFYSQLAFEDRHFHFNDVVHGLVEKLVSRHPHVFPDGTLHSVRSAQGQTREDEVSKNWETLKKQERAQKGKSTLLADIPPNLPSLIRAEKIQKRASRSGFDWQHLSGVFDKFQEEYAELREAVNEAEASRIEDELGDLLFTCVNLARHLQVDAESALRRATRKFEERFHLMEQAMVRDGEQLELLDPETKNRYWEMAKKE